MCAWPRGVPRGPRKEKIEAAKAASDAPPEPQAKPKKAKSWTAKAGNNWEIDAGFVSRVRGQKDVEWQDSSEKNRLAIDPKLLERLRHEGIVLQWVTHSVFGKEFPERVSDFRRNGWEYVHAGDIPGIHQVEIDGLKLMARPVEVHEKARRAELAKAREQVATKEQALLGDGIPGVSGGRHSSALGYNKINRSVEKVEIPRD